MFTRIQQKQSKQQCYEKFEAALKLERTVSVLTQGRPDSKRGALDTSQLGTSQSNRKKGKKWTVGRGSGRGVASSQGSVLSPAALGGGRSSGSSFPLCPKCQWRHLGECRMNMTGCFHCEQEGHFILNCPQLVAAETSEVGIVASTPGTSCPSKLVGVVQVEVAVQHLVEVAVGVQEAKAVPRLARYRVVLVLRFGYLQSHGRRQMHHHT